MKNAATLRDHPIANANDFRVLQYHRKCYQLFIMKRDLEDLKRKKAEIQSQIKITFLNLVFINVERNLYFYPKTYKFDKLVEDFITADNQVEELTNQSNKYSEDDQRVVNTSQIIKNEIKSMKDTIPWLPQPTDLLPDQFQIPHSLDLILDTMLRDNGLLRARKLILKQSFAQDLVYAVTVKTPKSILLPTVIKSLTNNTEVINVINKFGHGVSYTLLMETRTENAYSILEQQSQDHVILPVECSPNTFTIYVADNIDRNEETLSGRLLQNIQTYLFTTC